MKAAHLMIALMLLVPAAATAQHSDRPDNGSPDGQQAEQAGPGNAPSLPDQASQTAKQVVDTVFQFVGGTVQGLGDALQKLLGGGQQGNSSAQNSS